MGHEAEIKDIESETPEDETEENSLEVEEKSKAEEERREELKAEGKTEEEIEAEFKSEELEIVREGTLPQADNQTGIRKRINKLNTKVDSANTATAESNEALELERQRNQVLQIALEQATQPTATAPNPDDFDLGRDDPIFIQKDREHLTAQIMQQVKGQLAENTTQTQSTANTQAAEQALNRAQLQHYERVKDLKVSNYLDREDKALEILGTDTVNYIINKVPEAHNMLYYLGTEINQADAERLAHLTRTDVGGALLELGRLSAELKVQPKSKPKPAPDPDEEIQGGISSSRRRGKGPTFE